MLLLFPPNSLGRVTDGFFFTYFLHRINGVGHFGRGDKGQRQTRSPESERQSREVVQHYWYKKNPWAVEL